MKKVMFFRPLFYMGGTEIAILNLIKKLKGFEIYIGYSDETSDKEFLSRFSEYATVININEIDELKVDIFVGCSTKYHLSNSINKIKRDKTILWIHFFGNFDTSILSTEDKYKEIDSIVSVSNTLTDKLKKMYPHLSDLIHTVYNVIDDVEIKNLSNIPTDLSFSKTLNLVTVARVCRQKGFDRMLKLAKDLKESDIDFKWHVIGDCYYKDEFNRILKSYEDYKENFEWFGFLDNPHNIVKNCDYSVLLSDEETWGLVLTEAMLLGVPCISTDFDVAFEQIEDGKNGIILSRENLDSYKERIADILGNKLKYKKSVSKFCYDNELILSIWNDILNQETLEKISN